MSIFKDTIKDELPEFSKISHLSPALVENELKAKKLEIDLLFEQKISNLKLSMEEKINQRISKLNQ